MKRGLAWDTSTPKACVVAFSWDENEASGPKVVCEWTLDLIQASHAEMLMWGIHHVLESCRWSLKDLDLFGVGLGPGSFTGLRVALTTARTLARAERKPLVGISSMALGARPHALPLAGLKNRVVLGLARKATRGESYFIVGAVRSLIDCVVPAQGDFPGVWKRGVDEAVLREDEIPRFFQKRWGQGKSPSSWAFLGDSRLRESLLKVLPARSELKFPPGSVEGVDGRTLSRMVWEAHQAGLGRDPLEVLPRYLRESDAERNLRAEK